VTIVVSSIRIEMCKHTTQIYKKVSVFGGDSETIKVEVMYYT